MYTCIEKSIIFIIPLHIDASPWKISLLLGNWNLPDRPTLSMVHIFVEHFWAHCNKEFSLLFYRQVDTVYDVMCLVQHGLRTRRESATMVHEHSSRSHLVVTLTVISQAPSFFSKSSSGSSQDCMYTVYRLIMSFVI